MLALLRATVSSGAIQYHAGEPAYAFGQRELEDTTVEEVWLTLSDPVLIADSLPGCQYLLAADGAVDFETLDEKAKTRDWELSDDPEVIAANYRTPEEYDIPHAPTFRWETRNDGMLVLYASDGERLLTARASRKVQR